MLRLITEVRNDHRHMIYLDDYPNPLIIRTAKSTTVLVRSLLIVYTSYDCLIPRESFWFVSIIKYAQASARISVHKNDSGKGVLSSCVSHAPLHYSSATPKEQQQRWRSGIGTAWEDCESHRTYCSALGVGASPGAGHVSRRSLLLFRIDFKQCAQLTFYNSSAASSFSYESCNHIHFSLSTINLGLSLLS